MLARERTSPLIGLLAYYVVVGLVLALLVRFVPWLGQMLSMDFGAAPSMAEQFRGVIERPAMPVPAIGPLANTALLVAFAVLGGLVFALPVAWTYTVTKRHEGFDKSVVQMIVILPIAVAGVVLIVRGSVALAFALAGIVAAVRFRTTLKDVKDAVFAFVAIGIGLASGVQSWLIAGLLSLVFCLVILGMWRFDIGEAPSALAGRAGPMTLAEALAPGGADRAVTIGEATLVAPLTPGEIGGLDAQVRRLRHHVRVDALRGKRRYQHLLLVYAADGGAVEDALEDLLDDYAKRWRLVEAFAGRAGSSALEYLVRFKKKAEIAEFLERLENVNTVRAAELKSVKGLRDLIT